MLQANPVFENTTVLAQVQPPGGAHSRQHPFLRFNKTQLDTHCFSENMIEVINKNNKELEEDLFLI
tara:strand:- start:161 stop:358 length:198 start_codon:yes stop_codon:yes gene_type:complete